MSSSRWLSDGDIQEYRPTRRLVVTTVAVSLLLLAAGVFITLPGVAQTSVLAADPERIRVTGLGLSDGPEPGDEVTVRWASGMGTGVVTDVAEIPESNASAVLVDLTSMQGEVATQYERAELDLGPQRLLVALAQGLRS